MATKMIADGTKAAHLLHQGPEPPLKEHRMTSHRFIHFAAAQKLAVAAAWVFLLAGLPLASAGAENTATNDPSVEKPFLAENDAAMNKMMTDMSIQPSGDVDHDFVEMMVPHHQGAVDMAQAELRYGHNEQLRRIAQEIIVEQLQEIAAMRLALGQPLPPSIASPTQPAQVSGMSQHSTSQGSAMSNSMMMHQEH